MAACFMGNSVPSFYVKYAANRFHWIIFVHCSYLSTIPSSGHHIYSENSEMFLSFKVFLFQGFSPYFDSLRSISLLHL